MRAKKKPAMLEPDMQDAVIYTRYSSHNQRDCSIEQQVADCEIFARQNNLRVVKVYADRHLSGTTDNRPQFQQMLKDAAHGHWAYVICWKIDRFARNRYDSATYKFRLKKAGVRVLYAKESIPDGPEGILLESVLEGSAEYYSAALAQNIRRGMKYNAEQCKVNSGSIPFGYCKGPDGRFAIHEANAEVVREIFRKAAAGMPFVDIANDLNSRGLKTSRGGRWNKGSFRLLMNEAYIGVYHFSDTRIEGGMPALIDQGTFWAANERLKANSSVRGRHQDGGDYLLTGKLKCAHCGSYMIGFSGTGKSGELHYYYGCQKRRRERACKKANVPREWIERVVVKAALDYVLRPDVMEWIADAVMEYQEREAASAQLAALTAELEENQKATDNVMKAIEAGIITSTTKQRLLDLEDKAQDLKRAIELEKLSHVRLERDQVLFWLDRFRGGSLQSQEFRRKVIDAFVSVVYLSDDHLRIAFNYSGGSNAEADFDLVMDAEAAAGELSKKFAQGHVASANKKHRLRLVLFCISNRIFPAFQKYVSMVVVQDFLKRVRKPDILLLRPLWAPLGVLSGTEELFVFITPQHEGVHIVGGVLQTILVQHSCALGKTHTRQPVVLRHNRISRFYPVDESKIHAVRSFVEHQRLRTFSLDLVRGVAQDDDRNAKPLCNLQRQINDWAAVGIDQNIHRFSSITHRKAFAVRRSASLKCPPLFHSSVQSTPRAVSWLCRVRMLSPTTAMTAFFVRSSLSPRLR